MARTNPITPKEREFVERAEMVARYVDTEKKIIGIEADLKKANEANRSKAIKKLKKEFGYKIQMIIPN